MSQEYEIHVRGRVSPEVLHQLAGLGAVALPPQTILHAKVPDADALLGLRSRLHGLGVVVVESRRVPTPRPGGGGGDELAFLEPLTSKEAEVLGYLAELYSTEEIASAMFVSVNTVRTHIRSVLRKLGVKRRNAAVRRARHLGVLTTLPSQSPDVAMDVTGGVA